MTEISPEEHISTSFSKERIEVLLAEGIDWVANIESGLLATDPDVGYLIMDLDRELSDEVRVAVAALDATIRTRSLY